MDVDLREERTGRARKILVADSNVSRGERLAEACNELGMEGETVPHGSLALERALSELPDLIVSEVDLPLVCGTKLAEILRANPHTRQVRFLYLGPEAESASRIDVGDAMIPVTSSRVEVLRAIAEQVAKCDRIDALEDAKLAGDTVSGSLAQLPLADLLQVTHLAGKSGRIELSREGDGEHLELADDAPSQPRERGFILMRDGDVLQAEVGSIVGEKALFRMLAWREGEFVFEAGRRPEATVRISMPVRSLLAEGVRQIAEWDRMSLQLPPLSATVRMRVKTKDLPNIVHPLTQEVLLLLEHYGRVGDIVDQCTHPDYQVLRTLDTLAQRNIISVEQEPVRGLGADRTGDGLFGDAELRRLRDHLRGATPRGERIVAGKILVVAGEPGTLSDWVRLLRSMPYFEAAPELIRGVEPKVELAPLGTLRLESDLELELLQVPSGEVYEPLWPIAARGALATLFLHGGVAATALRDSDAKLARVLGESRMNELHVVLVSRKDKVNPDELGDNLSLLDDASMFLIPLEGAKEPTVILRSLFSRVVP